LSELLKPQPFTSCHYTSTIPLYIPRYSTLDSNSIDASSKLRDEIYIMDDTEDLKSPTKFIDLEVKSSSTLLNIVGQNKEQGGIVAKRQTSESFAPTAPEHGNQEEVITEDKFGDKKLELTAEMPDVVHGTLSNGDPATLIVLKFKFIHLAIRRRFKSATITVTFLDPDNKLAPAVQGIAPDGSWTLDPSKGTVEVTTTVDVTGITVPPGITVNGGISHARQITTETTYFTEVDGITETSGQNGRTKNAVEWALLENPATKNGIPTLLQGAILLKRNQSPDKVAEIFHATVEIDVEVDWKTVIDHIIHKTPKDAPVSFNTAQEPNGTNWNRWELEKVDLKALQKIIDSMPVNEPEAPAKRSDTPVKETG
jgi:hypothetical protein